MKDKLEALEKETLFSDDSADVPPPDIVAYNELRSCADLFRMYEQKIIEIHPDFQRDVVWNGPAQTRFIDSLTKQLPIPSMCFALDYKQQRWIVIDGLQRISSIIKFLKGGDWTLSSLDDVDPNLAGKSVAAIKQPDSPLHYFYTRVENLSIPITVLRCDFSKKSHMDYLFTIFHRLNTGGMKLNNQEIRNCIYSGSLNKLLKELDQHTAWRRTNKMKAGENQRFTKQELILRFFAFTDGHKKYTGHLAKFLNDYMHLHQNADDAFLASKKALFTGTADCIFNKVYRGKPPGKISLTIMEATLVGVGMNINSLQALNANEVEARYKKMVSQKEFSEASLTEGLSKKQKVIDRLDKSIGIFSGQ